MVFGNCEPRVITQNVAGVNPLLPYRSPPPDLSTNMKEVYEHCAGGYVSSDP